MTTDSVMDNADAQDEEARRAARKETQRRYRERHRERLNAQTRAWRAANPEKGRAYHAANRERIAARDRAKYAANPEKKRAAARRYASKPGFQERAKERRLAREYGITLERYREMITAQEGVCASCGGPPNQLGLVVDHCHVTGQVRELLCSKCNSALGLLDDNLAKVEALLRYLRRNSGKDD